MNENINLKNIPLKKLVELALEETPIIKSSETQLLSKPKLQNTREKIIQANEKQLEIMRRRAEEQRNLRKIRYTERDQVLSDNERELNRLTKIAKEKGWIL
jgi:hypothetical protein